MSICAGVIISVTFEKVDSTPHAKAAAKGDNEGLKDID